METNLSRQPDTRGKSFLHAVPLPGSDCGRGLPEHPPRWLGAARSPHPLLILCPAFVLQPSQSLPPVAVFLSLSPCHLPVLCIYCRVSGISPEWFCVGTSRHTSARAPFPGLQQWLGQKTAALSQAQPHITSPCARGGENLRGLGAHKGAGGRCHRGCHRGLVPAPG